MKTEHSVRNLLLALGISQLQADGVIQNMYQSPAVTDPKSPHIMLVVSAIQDSLNASGYQLVRTGYLDVPTALVMDEVVGPGWERLTWARNVAGVVARRRYPGMGAGDRTRAATQVTDVTFAGSDGIPGLSGMPFGLPDVPGGVITYAVAGFFLYKHFKKGRAAR